MNEDLRATLEEALGAPPWQRWEPELGWFADHLSGRASTAAPPNARLAIEAELRELLTEPEALKLLAEAERILRHETLRKIVWDEEGSIQEAPIVRSELVNVPRSGGNLGWSSGVEIPVT